jgi:cytosine permease
MAATGLTDDFPRFLSVLGIFVPSVAGVMWAEYYMIRGKKFVVRPCVNIRAVIGWIVGSIISWLSAKYGFGLPPINGIVVAGLVYFILMKLSSKEA